MKKLNIDFSCIKDETGYLFSFTKMLAIALKNSVYSDLAEDVIATSGFAFRMWVASDLCPSSTSIWEFDGQKPWVENSGLKCEYVGRYWNQDNIEEERRLLAIKNIKASIDNNIAAICWDIGVPEWGLIIGYNDDRKIFNTIAVNGIESEIGYDQLGKREISILSVLTIVSLNNKSKISVLDSTIKLAVNHLKSKEWCSNSKGLEAYSTLVKTFEMEDTSLCSSWQMEYLLGTYGSLKYYAYKYFEKSKQLKLAKMYKNVYNFWIECFNLKKSIDLSIKENKDKILSLLNKAYEEEAKALNIMEEYLKKRNLNNSIKITTKEGKLIEFEIDAIDVGFSPNFNLAMYTNNYGLTIANRDWSFMYSHTIIAINEKDNLYKVISVNIDKIPKNNTVIPNNGIVFIVVNNHPRYNELMSCLKVGELFTI